MRCLILPLAMLLLAAPARGQFLDRVPTARIVELAELDEPYVGTGCYSQSYQSSYQSYSATSQTYSVPPPAPVLMFRSAMPTYGVQAIRPGIPMFGGRARYRSTVKIRSRGFGVCGPGGCW